MAPVMAMLAQMQMYSFLKFTKSTLFAGIMILLWVHPFSAHASFTTISVTEGLLENTVLELDPMPELQTSAVLPFDTILPALPPENVWTPDTIEIPVDPASMQPAPLAKDEVADEPVAQEYYYPEIKVHSPLKATMLSATLPGLGQAYNGKYWKIPFLYAFIGGTVYAVDFNNRQYQYYRKNWMARVDGNPNTVDDFPGRQTETLQRAMNGWRRNVEIAYIVGAALYILNILDATVDAHLLDFDVGEDLSLNVMPMVLPQSSTFGNKMNPVSPGLRLSIRF